MPSANITALTALTTPQPSMLMYAALSPFGVTDDRKITANNLLATITANITDLSLQFDNGLGTATVSAAGKGKLRYNDTSKTFQFSADGAAYADFGGGGTPAAPDTSIQFNNAGSFGGSDALTFINASNEIVLGKVSTDTGLLSLANSASAFLTTIQAGNAAAAITYTWPLNVGNAGDVLTDAAGNGVLSWAAGGGSGNTTAQGTFAARPAASTNGNLYFSTDGFVLSRDTGAAYSQWGPFFNFIRPIDGDYAWINQGGAAVSDTGGGIVLSAPASATTNLRIRKKTAPGTPYTIDIAFLFTGPVADSFGFGFCWRQSSDGKLVTIQSTLSVTGSFLHVINWTDATTISAAPFATEWAQGRPFWIRAQDNGTDRIASVSADGQTWLQFFSIGRTDFLTADEVGFFINTQSATFPANMTLLHWKQS